MLVKLRNFIFFKTSFLPPHDIFPSKKHLCENPPTKDVPGGLTSQNTMVAMVFFFAALWVLRTCNSSGSFTESNFSLKSTLKVKVCLGILG